VPRLPFSRTVRRIQHGHTIVSSPDRKVVQNPAKDCESRAARLRSGLRYCFIYVVVEPRCPQTQFAPRLALINWASCFRLSPNGLAVFAPQRVYSRGLPLSASSPRMFARCHADRVHRSGIHGLKEFWTKTGWGFGLRFQVAQTVNGQCGLVTGEDSGHVGSWPRRETRNRVQEGNADCGSASLSLLSVWRARFLKSCDRSERVGWATRTWTSPDALGPKAAAMPT